MSEFRVASVIELVGESEQSWEDAVNQAVGEAAETLEHIQGVEVLSMTAVVENGRVTKYRAGCHVAFGVDDSLRGL
ncbi:MAG: dodecin family protein [Limnochordia bacterium]